jgi:UPF0213 protein SH2523
MSQMSKLQCLSAEINAKANAEIFPVLQALSVPEDNGYYVYMVCCSDNTLYTGWTTNVRKRLDTHNAGKGAKYTKIRRPVRLVYVEELASKQDAMKREYAIKQYTRKEKEKLIWAKRKEK